MTERSRGRGKNEIDILATAIWTRERSDIVHGVKTREFSVAAPHFVTTGTNDNLPEQSFRETRKIESESLQDRAAIEIEMNPPDLDCRIWIKGMPDLSNDPETTETNVTTDLAMIGMKAGMMLGAGSRMIGATLVMTSQLRVRWRDGRSLDQR
jgi:hypothetical protein